MNEEKIMTEKESMELITSMINKAKSRFHESGFLYLLWGWVVLICCIVQFSAAHFFNVQNAYQIWYITWLVLIYQIFFLRKKRKLRTLITYTEDINRYVWIVFGICEILLVFILLLFKKYEVINPVVIVLYGMPIFLSGIILKFKPLLMGGISCWVISGISPFVNIEFQLVLTAAAIICGWIVPGYMLRQKFKKEN
jgi:hypothetical protein